MRSVKESHRHGVPKSAKIHVLAEALNASIVSLEYTPQPLKDPMYKNLFGYHCT